VIAGQVNFFEPLPKEVSRKWYEERKIEQLPKDVLRACDQIRAQKQEIDRLRGDLIKANRAKFRLGVKNAVLMAVLGGAAAEGIKVAALALFKMLPH
jgi:hypothetical protein